jgi:hypothetical protein
MQYHVPTALPYRSSSSTRWFMALIVDVHKSRRSIFQSNQGDFDEKRDGRLGDGQSQGEMAMSFDRCNPDTGGERHE